MARAGPAAGSPHGAAGLIRTGAGETDTGRKRGRGRREEIGQTEEKRQTEGRGEEEEEAGFSYLIWK